MKRRNPNKKSRWIPNALLAVALVGLGACSQSERSEDEEAILASSAFYPGEIASGVINPGVGESGEIPAPGSGGSGSDTGSIPAPGGNTGGESGSGSGSGGANPEAGGGSAENGGVPSIPPITIPGSEENGSGGETAGGENSGGSGSDGGEVANNDPPNSGSGGSDGGTIPGGGEAGNGDDGGTIPPGNEGGSGGDGGGVAENDPPENENPDGNEGGEVAENDPPSQGEENDPPGQGGNGGSDNGDVANNDPPNNGENGGSDGGEVPGQGENGDGQDGGEVAENDPPEGGEEGTITELINIDITRVCSVRRSRTSSVFFEEANRPILSIEAYPPQPAVEHQYAHDRRSRWGRRWFSRWFRWYRARRTSYASFGFHGYPSRSRSETIVLQSVDLSQVDLFQGPFQGQVELDLNPLQQAHPERWESALVIASICDDYDGDGKCSNQTALTVRQMSFQAQHVPDSLSLSVWHGRHLTLASDPDLCERQYSPLILDLWGNGIRLTPAEEGVAFDLDDTGTPVYTGWLGSDDDALLVRDLNGNGYIDSGAELFGSATRLRNNERAANGFEALKELDLNRDKKITRADPAWWTLRLWRDWNYNAVSEPDELFSLRSLGVEEIKLDYVDVMEVDPHGNETRQRSTFRKRGRTLPQLIVDIWFRTLASW